jgi:hypothetical protein
MRLLADLQAMPARLAAGSQDLRDAVPIVIATAASGATVDESGCCRWLESGSDLLRKACVHRALLSQELLCDWCLPLAATA